MGTLQQSEKSKKHSNQVKVTLKTSGNHSEVSENHSKRMKIITKE